MLLLYTMLQIEFKRKLHDISMELMFLNVTSLFINDYVFNESSVRKIVTCSPEKLNFFCLNMLALKNVNKDDLLGESCSQ